MLHIKMILRSWWRNKLNTFISLLSLITGLVCSTILILFVIGEYRVANALGDTERVYLIEIDSPFFSQGNIRTTSVGGLGYKIASRYSDVEQYAFVCNDYWRITNSPKNPKNIRSIYVVTESFADMFDIKVKQGDLKSTLSTSNEIAVTESFMQEYYGRSAVIGDRITAQSQTSTLVNGAIKHPDVLDFTITTILDESTKTPFSYKALMPITWSNRNGNNEMFSRHGSICFIRLQPQAEIEQLQAQIKADTAYIDKDYKTYFTPFNKVYFDDANRDVKSVRTAFIKRRSGGLLIVGLSIALSVLIIAAFNYINITMTRARDRIKSIAGQYIFGASKSTLRWQIILDTLLIVLISFGISVLVIYTVLPQFNAFMDSEISLWNILQGWNWVILGVILALIVALSSLYIMLKLELNSPIENFKNPGGRKSTISNIMVITQISVSVVMIVVSLNISRQMNYILEEMPSIKSIIRVSVTDAKIDVEREFYNQLKSLAFVESSNGNDIHNTAAMSNTEGILVSMTGDETFINLYRLNLLEGRNFVDNEPEDNIIVNQTLLKTYKIEQPATGSVFNYTQYAKYNIIGVVEDFMFDDAHKSIQPLAIAYTKNHIYSRYLFLRISGNQDERIEQIRELWNSSNKGKGSIQILPYTQIIRDRHSQEQRLATIVNLFMYISILLTALGLFGLAFYTVGQRKKEIALRKINGSTTTGVILRLCRTFCVWTAIAFAIATPLAYYFSSDWLSTFTYRIDISLWVFVATAGIVMLITFLTVIFQSWRAASANPAKSIKSE